MEAPGVLRVCSNICLRRLASTKHAKYIALHTYVADFALPSTSRTCPTNGSPLVPLAHLHLEAIHATR
ncbi:hypothetical protein SCLCIDRAFT_169091 [Scleroderma citrinum Foug A]|uniref:Uncharacterized protein n=1 Tax=Scleroderma citrinum Foug A TaxID=1036808 RepID=A0A0C3ERL6_9AGAM|nr:hypothetical protein SCLCIDRAFT_169091 [Scleroderma citrinum Foug A]